MPGNFKRMFGCVTVIDRFWFSIPSNLDSLHYLCLSTDGMDGKLQVVLIWIFISCVWIFQFIHFSVKFFGHFTTGYPFYQVGIWRMRVKILGHKSSFSNP